MQDACPFCGAAVDEALVLYGGTCPKCFCEIPGEEAATDPGEAVKEAQERRDNRRAWLKAVVPIVFLVLPMMGILTVVALYLVFWPDPQVVVMDFDDYEEFEIEFVAAADPEAEKGEKGSKKGTAKRRPRPNANRLASNGANNVGGGGNSFGNLGGDGAAGGDDVGGTRGASGGAVDPGIQTPSNLGGSTSSDQAGLSLGIEVSTARRGAVLSDPEAIKKMIWKVMKVSMPKLQSCYEQRLKVDENLQGRWRLIFTVGKDGSVKSPSAKGLNMQDAEFESCLARKLSKWEFQRIKHDQPVQRSIKFTPAW